MYFWKFKGLSNERINSNTGSNYTITPELNYYGTKARVKFSGSCLRQDKATYNHETIVNIYIVYEISKNYNISSYPILENCFFLAISLAKHVDIDQYKYSVYGIGFDRKGKFSLDSNGFGKNCIILGADMSSSANILVLRKDFIQGLDNATIYAKKMYSISFTENFKKFCLSLHYNGANSFLFVNNVELHKFKAKDSDIVGAPLCLGNISKNFSVDNMKKIGLNGYIYDFSVDCDATAVEDILDIHKYLIH